MLRLSRLTAPALPLLLLALPLSAQTPPAKEPIAAPAATERTSVAATVNGQPIYEVAVERALQAVPTDERAKARAEVVQYLIDNAIVDQYLAALKVAVEPKEVETQLVSFKEEIKKHEQDYTVVLKRMKLTEAELRQQIQHQLCWEKFVAQQATDAKLKALFDHMPEAFDGTSVRARHILLTPAADAKAKEDAAAKLRQIKAEIEKELAAGLAKLPADADGVTKEKLRVALLEEAFGEAARKHSACPSKNDGGDLRWFPRYGSMVEPFAKSAFALKAHQISDVVTTPFGLHLILVTGRRPGVPTKFEDPKVKDAVKEVYESRLKEAVIEQMKPRAKIEIATVK
jgi:peptidyl-prolyl cis-trans isomerase C